MTTDKDATVAGPAGRLLVVDDEFSVRDSLEAWFSMDGHQVASASDAMDALRKLQEHTYDVVLLDIRMPGIDGLELQRRIHALDPSIVVIMITAFASVDTAVQALKEGAFDYVTKPIDPDELSRLVVRGLDWRRQRAARGEAAPADRHELVAVGPAMRRVLAQAGACAASDVAVLIRGESGSGRERLARHVHGLSGRRNFPFVTVPCAAFAAGELEDELFGHEPQAIDGARFRRKGRFEMAEGGTLLLEEVEAIEPRMQVELLRVLDSGEYTRLGGTTPLRADFRLMATTSADLGRLVAEGRFRAELALRLDIVTLAIPPLRERREDIPDLARVLLAQTVERTGRGFTGFSEAALAEIAGRDWPGNVRELARAVEHAVAVGVPPTIDRVDLPV